MGCSGCGMVSLRRRSGRAGQPPAVILACAPRPPQRCALVVRPSDLMTDLQRVSRTLCTGKGPGLDRAGDALKHANLAGASPLGGVLVLAGDDHLAKSSTAPHQSELALADAYIPVLNPAGQLPPPPFLVNL